jgi:hypothetical protein
MSRAVVRVCARSPGPPRAGGIRCLDLKPYLAEPGRHLYDETGEFLWWLDDTHWNHRGHDAVAVFVQEEVLRNGGGLTAP